MKKPVLFLFPNLLDEEGMHDQVLPKSVDEAVSQIDGLIAESEKAARRFLRRFSFPAPKTFREVPIRLLNEHTSDHQLDELLAPLIKGECWGLISDCGMPCLADPGSNLVFKARQKGVAVETFAGPSSILMALVLSGLGGQHFTFHGYLPKSEEELLRAVQEMQKHSAQAKSTHLFIEAPYRNEKLLSFLLKTLHEDTFLSLAIDLTASSQEVVTRRVREWKQLALPSIDKRPTVFLVKR